MEDIVRILMKWRKPIGLLTLAAALLSVIISFLLPEQFQSKGIFIPNNPYMMDAGSLFRSEASADPVYLFGGKNDIDRFLTLGESRALYSDIIKKFDLYRHYKIDTTDVLKDYYVSESLRSHFTMTKTSAGMIEIDVIDKDKHLAANMANEIMYRLDSLNKKVVMEKKYDVAKIYEVRLKERYDYMKQMNDSLYRTVLRNPKDSIAVSTLKMLTKYATGEYNRMYVINDQHQTSLHQNYSTIYIIEEAVPALRRAKPVRWIIVTSATLVAFVVGILGAFAIERFGKMSSQ